MCIAVRQPKSKLNSVTSQGRSRYGNPVCGEASFTEDSCTERFAAPIAGQELRSGNRFAIGEEGRAFRCETDCARQVSDGRAATDAEQTEVRWRASAFGSFAAEKTADRRTECALNSGQGCKRNSDESELRRGRHVAKRSAATACIPPQYSGLRQPNRPQKLASLFKYHPPRKSLVNRGATVPVKYPGHFQKGCERLTVAAMAEDVASVPCRRSAQVSLHLAASARQPGVNRDHKDFPRDLWRDSLWQHDRSPPSSWQCAGRSHRHVRSRPVNRIGKRCAWCHRDPSARVQAHPLHEGIFP